MEQHDLSDQPPEPLAVHERSYAAEPLLHRHPYYQMLFPYRGALQLRVVDQRLAVGPASWALIPPGAEHVFWSEGPNHFLVVDLAAPLVAGAVEDGPFHRPIDGRLAALAGLLASELRAGALAERPVAEALARYVGAAVAFAVGAGGPREPQPPDKPLAARARDYLDAHAREPVSLAEVAAAVGASVAHLQRSFRAAYGVSVVDYLQALRVRHAAGLLRSTTLPVEAIAAAVGFTSPSYFSRLFARHVGVSPARYRARGGEAGSGSGNFRS